MNPIYTIKQLFTSLLVLLACNISAQITITPDGNANNLAQLLAGQGVVVTNATLNCDGRASAQFSGGTAALGFTLDEGIVLGTGNVSNPNAGALTCTGTDLGTNGYNMLNPIAGAATQDACILEFDVEVTTNQLEFKYVFTSDEYPEYVGSSFNDAFGFFISGPGIAGQQNIGVIPGTNDPITINTVNDNTNTQYYTNNNRAAATGYDGTTTVVTATASVQPCGVYHFILAIADASDGCFDSSVFLERSSLVSVGVDLTEPVVSGNLGAGRIYENCDSATYTFELPTQLNDDYGFNISIKGTAENGVDYRFLEDSLVIPAGSTTFDIVILPLNDSIVDPGETVEICILDPCTGEELICEEVTIEELEADISDEQFLCYGQDTLLEVTFNNNYNYSWSPTNGLSCTDCHNPTAGPLDTTTYIVTVSDLTCSIEREVTVNVAAPNLPPIQDTIACIDSTKNVDVTTPGFETYTWTPVTTGITGTSSPTPTFTVLDTAVTYQVEAENDYGCLLYQDITITPRPAVEAELIPTHLLCFGDSNGVVNANILSPSAIDRYEWSDGAIGNPNTNLKAGDYEVMIYDIYGCLGVFDTTLLQPDAPLEVEARELLPAQCGGLDGEAEGVISGGTEPYNITWSPAGGNQTLATGLAGNIIYTFSVVDANGCRASDTAFVRDDFSNLQDATITPFGPFCAGADPFTVETAMPGGVWSGPGMDQSGVFTPGDAGNGIHEVIYTLEAGLCSDADTFNVEVNTAFQADMDSILPLCELSDPVNITSVTSGGLYWGPGIADSSFARFSPGLAGPGTHRIFHLVEGECGEVDSLDVIVIPAEVGQIAPPQNFCPTGMSGTLSAQPNGGTWSGAGIDPTGNFDPTVLGTGVYKVYYTPQSNCRLIDSALVTVVDTIRATPQNIALLCNGDANGSVTTTVTGGETPYTFNWNGGVAGNTPGAIGLSAGSYPVTVTGNLGCSVSVTHQVTEPTPIQLAQPTAVINNSCNRSCDGEVQFFPSGGVGSFTYSIVPSNGAVFNGVDGYTNLCAGNYTATITDANGCFINETFAITQPNIIVVDATPYTAFCAQANGGITVNNVTGGTATGAYTYLWSNGATTQSLDNVTPGTYNLEVTDANGCVLDTSFSVPNSGGPTLTSDFSPVVCNGDATGKVWVTATGGQGSNPSDYTYEWLGQTATTDTLFNVPIGTYTVIVRDLQNCPDTISQVVTEPTVVQLTDVVDTTLCVSQVYHERLMAQGGNVPTSYTFEMNGGALAGDSIHLDQVGVFYFQAFDDRGCPSNTIDVEVDYLNPISLITSPFDSICAGDQINKSVVASGGRPPYSYSWDGGPTSDNWNYQSDTGTVQTDVLTVVVSDGCSPDESISTEVRYFPVPEIDATPVPNQGCEPLDVVFTLSDQDYQSIEWKLDNGTYTDTYTVSQTFEESGTYEGEIRAISKNGCPVKAFILPNVVVHPVPEGEIKVIPNELTILKNTAVFQVAADVAISQIDWSLSNDSGPVLDTSGLSIFYNFPKRPREYTLFAEYTTPFGCVNTAEIPVEVKSEDILFVPTAFSPNGDGINEAFFIEVLGEEAYSFTVSIHNRWGEMLFQSADRDFRWDGVYQGNGVQPGVYVWRITYQTLTGISRDFNGTVTLIR